MSSIPTNPNARLTRTQLAQALKEAGYPVEVATLATMASRGGGPRYELFGQRAYYTWRDGLRWAKSRLSAPRHQQVEPPRRRRATRQRNRTAAEATTT